VKPTEPIRGNQELWDELAPIHLASKFYDVEGFRSGNLSLRRVELDEVGEVRDKRLLHLQCHFGLDTLSWARLGAHVTGIDLSPKSIDIARNIASDLDIPARFIQANLYDLPRQLDEAFDVVFCSYGSIQWLPDLEKWAQLVRRYTADAGLFYMVEFHPVIQAFADTAIPQLAESYFYEDEPVEWRERGTYAEPGAHVQGRSYQWHHPIGDVVTALVNAGLEIEFVREHASCPEQLRTWMVQDESGWWRAPHNALPLLFSIRATTRASA